MKSFVVIKSKKGEKVITDDEHPIRGCTMETLAKLKPAFRRTASSPLLTLPASTTAAAVILMSWESARNWAEAHG